MRILNLFNRSMATLIAVILVIGMYPLHSLATENAPAPNTISVYVGVYDYTAVTYGAVKASDTGVVVDTVKVTVPNTATALDAIKVLLDEKSIPFTINAQYNYFSSINGLSEYDCGSESGWMFSVNNNFGNLGASLTSLSEGDQLQLHYSIKGYGTDVGNYWSGGPAITKVTLGGTETVISSHTSYADANDYVGTTTYYLGNYITDGQNTPLQGMGTVASPYAISMKLSAGTDMTNLVAQVESTLHPHYISYGTGEGLTDISKATDYSNIVTFCLQTVGGYCKTYYTITATTGPQITCVTFSLTPIDALLKVYDNTGTELTPDEGTLTYSSLIPGASYTYTASKSGFISEHGTFVTSESAIKKVTLVTATAPETPLPNYTGDWTSFRGNDQNMGLTSVKTARTEKEAVLKWAVKYSGSLSEPITPPIIVNDSLYIAQGNKIVKINPETGQALASSKEMVGSVGYALNPVTYGGGMIFVPVGSGSVQALRADTLESVWISEPLGGQTLTPATYHDGYIYTGTWNSETKEGTYFCLSVTDEDTSRTNETKYCTWKVNHKGGFYWAGAYATDRSVIFGGDDGELDNSSSTAVLYSVQPTTGEVIDTIKGIKGDIRSTVSYDSKTDRIYFTTKGGEFYQVKVNEDGSFDDSKTKKLDLGGMCTGSPLVFNGLAYLGVAGPSQYSQAGHSYKIIDVTTSPMKEVGSADIPGYVQTSALLSTAYYANTNKVYLYTTYNYTPGGIYVVEVENTGETDADGAAVVTTLGSHLFIPESAQAQYCICSLVSGRNGVIYYKNDSGYLMAVSKKSLTDKAITSFSIGSYKGTIDETAKTISVTVAYNADLTALTPTITTSEKANVIPTSGTSVNFTAPVPFAVTAEDGSTCEYVVTVTKKSNSSGGTPSDSLMTDKTNAKASLLEVFQKCSKSDFTSDNWNLVKTTYDTGVANIEAATTYVGLSAALNQAIEAIGKIETKSAATITVCVAMEKFTLGQGYLIEPTLVKVPKYTPASVVITDLLKEKFPNVSQPYRISGSVTDGFYLSYVYDTDTNLNVPGYILNALGSLDTRGSGSLLGEFDYSNTSGWMYCINGTYPSASASSWRLSSKEVMRWQFSLYGHGADIDADNNKWGQSGLKSLADKDALTWRVAELNGMRNKAEVLATGQNQEKYDTAMAVLEKIDSTQSEVDNALSELNNLSSISVSTANSRTTTEIDTGVIQPSAVISNSSARATETTAEVSKAIEAAKKTNAVEIVIAPVMTGESDSITIVIPKVTVENIANNTDSALLVKTNIGSVSIPKDVLSSVSKESGSSVEIRIVKVDNKSLSKTNQAIVGEHPVFDLSILVDHAKFTNFGSGTVTVTLPYAKKVDEDISKLVIYYIDDNGNAIKVSGAKYDAITGLVTFQTNHFSCFAIVYEKQKAIQFDDVGNTHWAKDYISYLAGKGIINGKSENIFAPDAKITRAEFITILARISGEAAVGYTNEFEDVKASDWFAGSVAWAVKNGITNGKTPTGFSPNDSISRQDMAAMIVRFAKALKFELPLKNTLTNFTDSETISGYAKDAIIKMQTAGILSGKNENRFMPQDNATRAEASKMLAILVQEMDKK